MQLKEIVDDLLKQRNRSLSWLAQQIGKTFDGLKLSLLKESVKYSDVKRIAEVLNVSPGSLFPEHDEQLQEDNYTDKGNILEEENFQYGSLRKELVACKELTGTLKDQLKDKEKIIELLNKI